MIARRIFYFIVKSSFYLCFLLYNRLSVRGMSNIPRGVPVVVASNHASNIDPPLIGGIFPGRLRYLAKESLFRNPLLGFLISVLGAVPVTREDSQRAGAVMKLMLGRLEARESILIFPEGTRTKDGRMLPLEGGAAFLAAKSGAPILPVYIDGSYRVCPPGKSLPRPVKLTVTFGAPICPALEPGISEREKRQRLQDGLQAFYASMEGQTEASI